MFKTIIQDAINSIEERSLRTVILSAIRSHVGTTRSSKARSTAPEQIRKITGHTGKHPNSEGSDVARDAEQPISGAEATSSQFSTSQSTSNTMKDPEGIRRRVIASDVQRAETEDESNAEGKWILIALPKDKFMTVEHMDVIRAQTDVQLFCEIRKRYEARRQLRRRFLELHDVNKLHLVKVRFFPRSHSLVRAENVTSSTFAKSPKSLGSCLMLHQRLKSMNLRTKSLT